MLSVYINTAGQVRYFFRPDPTPAVPVIAAPVDAAPFLAALLARSA